MMMMTTHEAKQELGPKYTDVSARLLEVQDWGSQQNQLIAS